MELHWRDVKNPHGEWSYLEVEVSENTRSRLQLFSGGRSMFKLEGPKGPVCWGNIKEGYYGAWLLRNDNEWSIDEMPVRPIQSADVEKSLAFSGFQRSSYWAKFFAQSMQDSNASPLYQGKWSLTNKKQYIETSPYDLPVENPTAENKAGFYQTRPLYLDWGSAGSYAVIALKTMPYENEGRVKWWRKKVKDGCCPPVLIWFITCLQAYIVIDGHSRLRAFQLEGEQPDYMVLKSIIEYERKPYLKNAEQVLKCLEKRQQHAWKKPLTVEQINELLTTVYDARPFISNTSSSVAIKDFEQSWLEEVRSFSGRVDTDEDELEEMLFKPGVWPS